MNWETVIISILGSGVISVLVNSLINHKTQIEMIRESGLYTKRANVLDNLMKRMERLDQDMESMISFFQTKTSKEDEIKRRENTYETFNSFVKFYKRNRHYLASNLSDEIGKLCRDYKDLFMVFSYNARPIDDIQNTAEWKNVVDKYYKDFPEKKEKITKEFRKIIRAN